MNYTPKKNNKGKKLSIIFLTISLVGLFASSLLTLQYRLFYQLVSLLFTAVSFELLNRYYLTTYMYELTDEDFIIRKSTGQKVRTVCNLSLKTLLGIEKQAKTKQERAALAERYGKERILYHYTQSLAPKNAYSLFFEFNGKTAEIVFEPNDEMVCRLQAESCQMDDIKETFFE